MVGFPGETRLKSRLHCANESTRPRKSTGLEESALTRQMGLKLVELTGDNTPDTLDYPRRRYHHHNAREVGWYIAELAKLEATYDK